MAEPGTARDELLAVIVVDDEIDVREGIRDRIDWSAIGLTFAGEFADGRAALEAARANPPDIVLSDIRMPRMDGIELATQLRAELPDTTVVLLTGHDEFEYAHAALRLQVDDFLLKPISAAQLGDALVHIAERIRRVRTRAAAAARLRERWEASLPVLRGRALEALLVSGRPIVDAVDRCRDLGIDLPHGRWRVALFAPDDHPSGGRETRPADVALLEISDAVEANFSGTSHAYHASIGDECIAVLWFGDDESLFDALETARKLAGERIGTTVSVAVGPAAGRLADIRSSYEDAVRALAQRFFDGGDTTYHSGPSASQRDLSSEAREVGRDLAASVRARRGDEAIRYLGTLIDTYRRSELPVALCRLGLQRQLARLLEVFEELGVDILATAAEGDIGNPFARLVEATHLDSIQAQLELLVSTLMDRLGGSQRSTGDRTIEAAKEILRDRYRDHALSLTDVCEELSVSVSHFSQQFKRVTGQTFVEYLTDIRIEAAQQLLLQQDMRSYEIAPLVGFRDPHYFSRTFKRQCGITPTEYREQHHVDGVDST